MSYILEALKKSQQERELGKVPTLETDPFSTEKGVGGTSSWVLLAVLLAMLAVIIALYAALRGKGDLPEATQPVAEQVSGPGAQTPGSGGEESGSVEPEATPGTASTVPDPEAVASPEDQTPVAKPEPVEPADTAQATARAEDREAAAPPARSRPPEASEKTEVPADLRADIEAFKKQVLDEKSTAKRAPRPDSAVPPQKLRLPREVETRLPEFLMTAHVYDEEPAKRFVLINGLKTREGESTREELTLEEVLPDGAVLSYEGHKFFRHRR